MDRMHGPTGVSLVGATFVCFCLILTALAADNADDLHSFGELDGVLAHHSGFVHHSQSSDLSCLGTLSLPDGSLTFPWSKRMPSASNLSSNKLLFGSPPTRDEIVLSGCEPVRKMVDYGRINSDFENVRDAVDCYDNCYTVSDINDSKLKSCLSEDLKCAGPMSAQRSENLFGNNNMNNMNIEVGGISVRAVNTVQGGNAVATSNIVIKPVQFLICPPEVEEKLK
jgi:hypothetical protein